MVDSHRSIVSLGSVQGLEQNGHANVVFDDVAVTADKAGTSSGVGLFAVVEPPSPEAGSAVPIESVGLVAAASIQEIGASRHSAIGTNSGSNSTEMAGVATPSGGSVGSKNSGFVVGTSAQQQRGPAFRSNRSIVADIFQQSLCSSRGILVQHRQHKVVDEVGMSANASSCGSRDYGWSVRTEVDERSGYRLGKQEVSRGSVVSSSCLEDSSAVAILLGRVLFGLDVQFLVYPYVRACLVVDFLVQQVVEKMDLLVQNVLSGVNLGSLRGFSADCIFDQLRLVRELDWVKVKGCMFRRFKLVSSDLEWSWSIVAFHSRIC